LIALASAEIRKRAINPARSATSGEADVNEDAPTITTAFGGRSYPKIWAFAALALSGFWCILKAAAIARRRTRIALDQPLHALWQTIGAAGHPPRDHSRQFATYAVILLVLAWIVVPIAIAFAVRGG
jgi:hypothetical protein